jgi:hypothetical protein
MLLGLTSQEWRTLIQQHPATLDVSRELLVQYGLLTQEENAQEPPHLHAGPDAIELPKTIIQALFAHNAWLYRITAARFYPHGKTWYNVYLAPCQGDGGYIHYGIILREYVDVPQAIEEFMHQMFI